MTRITLAVVALCFSMPLLAHHSRAEFSGDVIELQGEITRMSWRNPHPTFRIRLADTGETWDIQAHGSLGTLNETGVQGSMFAVGQKVTFAGLASGRRQLFLGTSALLPDGTEAVLQYSAKPHWNGRHVGGSGSVVIDPAVLARATTEDRGFFRTWSPESTEIAVSHLRGMALSASFTDLALSARDSWDLTDNPITRCEPSWVPHTMFQPVPLEFIDNGDTLTLNNAYYNSVRTIYMHDDPVDMNRFPHRLGLSRGRWEGDILVIETDNITAPAFSGNGRLQSDRMRLVERFSLGDDQSRLDYELVMTDPVALNEPAVYRTYYLALGREIGAGENGGNCG